MPELLVPTALAAVFGYSNKMADLLNEHGLRLFPGADLLYGLLFGISGALLILYDSVALAPLYLALTLSWFLFLKLDYRNHALAGVMMVLAGTFVASRDGLDLLATALLTAGFVLGGVLQHKVAELGTHRWRLIARLRLRIYLVALVFAVMVQDLLPFVTTLVGMAVVEAVTAYYKRVRGLP